jgi:hypothetical protein
MAQDDGAVALHRSKGSHLIFKRGMLALSSQSIGARILIRRALHNQESHAPNKANAIRINAKRRLITLSLDGRWQRIVLRPPDKGAASEASGGFLNPPAFGHPPCQGGLGADSLPQWARVKTGAGQSLDGNVNGDNQTCRVDRGRIPGVCQVTL